MTGGLNNGSSNCKLSAKPLSYLPSGDVFIMHTSIRDI